MEENDAIVLFADIPGATVDDMCIERQGCIVKVSAKGGREIEIEFSCEVVSEPTYHQRSNGIIEVHYPKDLQSQ